MEQSPAWEANSSSASREIPCVVWNPNFHCHVHNILLLVTVLSQISLVHAFSPSHFFKIHFNIIVQSTPRCSKWSFSNQFPHQTLYAPDPSFIVLHALPTILLIFHEQYKLKTQCSSLQSPVTSRSYPKHLPQHPLAYVLSSVWQMQVSHLSKTTGTLLFCIF
jgi:hypothetical protein